MSNHWGARSPESGFSLIELLLVIVILGIAAATLTVVSARSAEISASVMKQQQAHTLAESMVEEIRAMPFTYCEPTQDAVKAGTVSSPALCTVSEDSTIGPEAGEARWSANRVDNVNDYNNLPLNPTGLRDASNSLLTGVLPSLSNCQARAAVSRVALPPLPLSESLRIVVTVTCPDLLAPVTAEAIRVRFEPHLYQY